MNLDELKKNLRTTKAYEWCGTTVHLRKLSAADHLEIFGRIKDESAKARDEQADRDATLAFHMTLVAKTLSDEGGELILTTKEQQDELLAAVSFADLVALGDLALTHSGYGDGEKKS